MKKGLFGMISLVCAFIFVFCLFSSCALSKYSDGSMTFNGEIKGNTKADSTVHFTQKGNLKSVAKTDDLELYFDSTTCSFAVKDKNSSYFWTALPIFDNENAAMLSAVVFSEDGRYYLNSQDNSVAFGSCDAKTENGEIKLEFVMSDNFDTALKFPENLQKGELYVKVPITVSLSDDGIYAKIDSKNIYVSDGFVLESLSLLPSFGAVSYSDKSTEAENEFYKKAPTENPADENKNDDAKVENGDNAEAAEAFVMSGSDADRDFMLVPDGCGAVIYTDGDDENTENLSFNVYNNAEKEKGLFACIPAFGIKKNESAFVALVENGDCNATIRAKRSGADIDEMNTVFAEFTVTETVNSGKKIYYKNALPESLSVVYRFCSGKSAGYSEMASLCREQLIRDGVLNSGASNSVGYPVNIAVLGSVDGGYSALATDFEATEDMLSVIKAKGINNVNLIMQGIFNGGLLQGDFEKATPMRKLGGKGDFNSLREYAQKQKFSVFAGINIVSSGSSLNSAVNTAGKSITAEVKNPLAPYIGKTSYEREFITADKIEKNVSFVMNSVKKLEINGVCINDAALNTYSDALSDKNATEVAEIVAENVSAFSVKNALMLNGCNFNVIKNADYIIEVPLHSQLPESDFYSAVPFVQEILHSMIAYSGTPINAAEVPELEMLKYAEYGAIPYFEWVASTKSHLYYAIDVNEAAEFAAEMSAEFSDLTSARIVNHAKVDDGVYMTEFDTGTVIYVNYNNFSVDVGKISVSPYDYLRIN